MKKTLPIIVVAVAVIVLGIVYFGSKVNKIVDWEETFNEKSNQPYGVSILYKEFPKLFKDHSFRTVYYTPYNYLIAHSEGSYGDHVAKGTYVIIGRSYYNYDNETSYDELLNFASNGNTLFVSDYDFVNKLTDTLQVVVDYIDNDIDSTYQLSFNYHELRASDTKIDRSYDYSYFSKYNEIEHKVLGYSNRNENKPNFIEVLFGDGKILLHLEPKIFTNYNMLKEDRYKYVEGVLSYLPEDDIYFDSYTKIFSGYNGNAEQKSDLSWFLQQKAFRWAWYLAIILTLLFIIFNAKRRQRIIQIIKPLQNTTVAFVKSISNLYFETQDHKNLIDKKVTYFLEKVRIDYNLETAVLDDEFKTRLASKSGNSKEDVSKLIDYIIWLRSKNEFFEENLINLNRHIEKFYSK